MAGLPSRSPAARTNAPVQIDITRVPGATSEIASARAGSKVGVARWGSNAGSHDRVCRADDVAIVADGYLEVGAGGNGVTVHAAGQHFVASFGLAEDTGRDAEIERVDAVEGEDSPHFG